MVRGRVVGLFVAALVVMGVSPAVAQEGVSGSNDVVPVPPTVSGSEVSPGSGDPVDVSGDPADPADPADPGGSLPFTGGDVMTLVIVAIAALGVGGLLLFGSRRRAHHQLDAGHVGG